MAVRLFSPWIDRIGDYRLVHLFGMSREGLELAKVARRRGVPVVLSPICWLERKALYCLARSRAKGLWDVAKWTAKVDLFDKEFIIVPINEQCVVAVVVAR